MMGREDEGKGENEGTKVGAEERGRAASDGRYGRKIGREGRRQREYDEDREGRWERRKEDRWGRREESLGVREEDRQGEKERREEM